MADDSTYAVAPLAAASLWGGMYVVSKWGFASIPPVTLGFILLGWYNYSRTTDGNEVSLGAADVNALLGLWVMVAPFLFTPGTAALWNDVIVGALVAMFGGYNAYAATTIQKQPRSQPA